MANWGLSSRRAAAALLVVAIGVAAWGPVRAGSRAVSALAKLEQGRWLVHSATEGKYERSLCLGDPALLFQVEHGASGCAQELVAADARGGTVHYTCSGRGYGHTSVRIETAKVATIDTQGLVDGRPFAYRATARKVSDC